MSGTVPVDDNTILFTFSPASEPDWSSSQKLARPKWVFVSALALSLAAHAVLFQWNLSREIPEERQRSPASIHITLNYVAPVEPLEVSPVAETAQKPIAEVPKVAAPVQAAAELAPIESPRAEVRLIQLRESYMPDNTIPATPVVRAEGRPFDDVFDPRLRQRLQNQSLRPSRPASQEIDPGADVYGNTFAKRGNEGCMRAGSTASGEPTNWYMTSCRGQKSEGEQMMERVNRELRSRR